MRYLLFEDEIILFWEIDWESESRADYTVRLNGVPCGTTRKTHFTLKGLTPDTAYEICIDRQEAGSAVPLFRESLRTPAKRRRIDVTAAPYFAVGDGSTVNTRALQAAIDDCRAGETVYFPQGRYLSGALDLHAGIELYLEKGATLQGSGSAAEYLPKVRSRFEGWELDCYRALINIGRMDHDGGYTCGDVVLRGGGTILGGGVALMQEIVEAERARLSGEAEADVAANAPRARGRLIAIANSERIVITDLALGYGAAWNVHMLYSRDVVTCNCSIRSEGIANGDGWDPDSSEDCTAFHIDFSTHDDAIAIKSGKNPEGNLIARPTRHIRIFDCCGRDGIAIGSELSGGVSDVRIWDCDMRHEDSRRGFRIKTTEKRGGYVRDVRVRDSRFAQICIYTGYTCNDDGGTAGALTDIRDITLLDVTCPNVLRYPLGDGKWVDSPGFVLEGFEREEHHLRNITVRGLTVERVYSSSRSPILLKNVKRLTLEGVDFVGCLLVSH